MLTFDRLCLRQGNFTLGADWSLPQGALVGLLGPSGSGKSTLLAALAGFVTPASGRILWQGQDLGPLAPSHRPLTILFQDQNLFPHLDLRRNLGLGLSADLRLGPGDPARIEAALARVGLAGFGGRKPGSLSGGQAARAALARALLRARPIMALDEPFAALGPAQRAEMLTLVRDLAQDSGATVLLVSHDPAELRRFASLTSFVCDGQALAPQPTADLLDNPPPALRAYLG